MSIVGPRPERPEIAAEYEKEMPEFRLRLQARAGLTGYAQVYGKYNTTPYGKPLVPTVRPYWPYPKTILKGEPAHIFLKASVQRSPLPLPPSFKSAFIAVALFSTLAVWLATFAYGTLLPCCS